MFIGPAVLLLVLLVVYPLFYSLVHSLQHWDLQLAPTPLGFVGLRNYQRVVADPSFWSAAAFTLEFVVVVVVVELALGTLLALLLDQRLPATQLARTLIIMPTAVAPIVAGFMFRYLYYPGTGLIAYLLALVGVPIPPTGILGSTTWAPTGLELTDIWQWTPFVALVLLAGIQSVPQVTVEPWTSWSGMLLGAHPVALGADQLPFARPSPLTHPAGHGARWSPSLPLYRERGRTHGC